MGGVTAQTGIAFDRRVDVLQPNAASLFRDVSRSTTGIRPSAPGVGFGRHFLKRDDVATMYRTRNVESQRKLCIITLDSKSNTMSYLFINSSSNNEETLCALLQ